MERSTRKARGRVVSTARSPRSHYSANVYLGLLVLAAIALMAVLFIRINARNQTAVAEADPVMASSATPERTSRPVRPQPVNVPSLETIVRLEDSTAPVEVLFIEPRTRNPRNVTPPRAKRALDQVEVLRISNTWSEDLRNELCEVPEVGFDQFACEKFYKQLLDGSKGPPNLGNDCGLNYLALVAQKDDKPELNMLPWRKGAQCKLEREAATDLQKLSRTLRGIIASAPGVGRDPLQDVTKRRAMLPTFGMSDKRVVDDLRNLMTQDRVVQAGEWRKKSAVPTLVQMLQHESLPIRGFLIELLGAIPGDEASIALAGRAIYDHVPEVRAKAIEVLSKRPITEYRNSLLDGLNYPWPAVAEHAAEALAALDDQDCIPELVRMLQWPNPSVARLEIINGKSTHMIREVVRLNHLSNCMICHPPSFNRADQVRGRVAIPGEPPRPRTAYYEEEKGGTFVRADITYLRQDFSVMHPVANRGSWEADQRFDYLVRTRPAHYLERSGPVMSKHASDRKFPQRQAILFALRELYGSDLGTTYEDWLPALEAFETSAPSPGG